MGPTNLVFINEQLELLRTVKHSISSAPDRLQSDLQSIVANIEVLREDIKVGREDDLPRLFHELDLQQKLYDKFSTRAGPPPVSSPYFGHMKLVIDGREREILLGHQSYSLEGRNIRIVDWRHAPIASVFYNHDEGEFFDLELPDRDIVGTLLMKSILTIINGQLVRIDRGDESYILRQGEWESLNSVIQKLSGGEGSACRDLAFGTGQTGLASPAIASLLDKDQFSIINNLSRRPLLLIGGAGSGKTTVALHRIATLCKKKKAHANSVLVVVPHEGLVRLSRDLLFQIGLRKVRVRTNDDWFSDQCRRLFPDLSKRVVESTPLAVSMLKRHGSMVELLKLFVEKKEQEACNYLHSISEGVDLVQYFNQKPDAPLLYKLQNVLSSAPLNSIQRINIKDQIARVYDINSDRLELLCDPLLLGEIVSLSGSVITERMVYSANQHTRYQMKEREDEGNNKALDGRDVHAGSIFELSGTVDQEDFPILLALLIFKTGGLSSIHGNIKDYDHLVLDEAQELSPVELLVFGRVVEKRGSITVAGDAAQQIDPSISFHGWDHTIKQLGLGSTNAHELKISYRSPQSIVDFSHDVLGPYAPPSKPLSKKQGQAVIHTLVQHIPHASIVLRDSLLELLGRENKASICVICNSSATADLFYHELRDLGNVRLVENSEFSFKPGIDVATIDQIRGLEFDYVIIPDGNKDSYPENVRARKRLHLAATRAIHQLWVLSPGSCSTLINL